MKDVTLSVRIDPEIARLFRKLAEQRGVSVSDLLRDAIKDSLFDLTDTRRVIPWRPETRSVTASSTGIVWFEPLREVA